MLKIIGGDRQTAHDMRLSQYLQYSQYNVIFNI